MDWIDIVLIVALFVLPFSAFSCLFFGTDFVVLLALVLHIFFAVKFLCLIIFGSPIAMADSKMMVCFAASGSDVKVLGVRAGSIFKFSATISDQSDVVDLTDNMDKLREVLNGMTVKELVAVFDKLMFGGLPSKPQKGPLINTFVGNIERLKANALRLAGALADNETSAGGASSAGGDGGYVSAFQGQGHKLSGDDVETDPKESSGEDALVIPLTEKDDDTEKDFLLIVKSPDLDQHLFLKINRRDTVLNVKDMIMRPSLDGLFDKEEDFMVSAVMMEIFDKEKMKEFDNFTTFAEIFPNHVHGGEVLLFLQKDFDKNSELAKALVSGSYFRKVMRSMGEDINGINIQTVHPSMRKGTMEVRVCENVKVFYQFGVLDTVADVCEALAKRIDDGLDFGEGGCFRLKHHGSASFMFLYQPLWAEFGDCPIAEVVVSLRGGGKRAKADTTQEQNVKDMRNSIAMGLTQLKSFDNPPEAVIASIQTIETLLKETKDNPKNVASLMLKQIPKSVVSKILAGAMGASTRPNTRVKFIAESALPELHEQLEQLGRMEKISIETIQSAIHLALNTQFHEPSGQTSWSSMLKELTENLASSEGTVVANPPADEGACITM